MIDQNNEPKHSEAFALALHEQDNSNLARCYLELSYFAKEDLPLAICSLENALEELNNIDNSSLNVDIEKAINSLKDISQKVGKP